MPHECLRSTGGVVLAHDRDGREGGLVGATDGTAAARLK